MGIRQRCWTAIALCLLSLPGSQLTSTHAMVLAVGDSSTNTGDPGLSPLNLASASSTNNT
jgi:hypothetical protein